MSYPCPLQDFYKAQRAQYLYLASELTAAGMPAGDILTVTWTVTAPYTITGDADMGLIEGYSISMKNTATSSLTTTGWESGLTSVYGPTDHIPFEGENTFTLSTPFYWDGISNLLIEVCGGTSTGQWEENAQCVMTTGLAFNGARTYRSDTEPSPCVYTGILTTSPYTSRPQPILSMGADVDCSGMPTVGAANTTETIVCMDDVFTLSILAILDGGITYQWQSSIDGGATWNDMVGATSNAYDHSQYIESWYRCMVTCTFTGDVAYSDPVLVEMFALSECYCEPTYTTGTGSGDYISNVTLGSINNTTAGAPSPYYTYYEGISTDLTIGSENTISITVGYYGSNNDVAAWIDWNIDGDFDDAGEKLGEVQDLAGWGTGAITFTVPGDALIGPTLLRTRESYGTTGILPCNTYGWGETEDYDINIISAVPTCDMATGLYVDNITATTTDLHWDAVDGATDYLLTVADIINRTVWMQVDATSNSWSLSGLTPGWDYGFKVKAYCLDDGLVAPVSAKHFWSTPLRAGAESPIVTLFPNPNSGIFSLQIEGYANSTFDLMVYDALGRRVYFKTVDITTTQYTENISLDNLPGGMYQVKLLNGDYELSYPVMIQK
jgi:hypothetical protein